jgi:hypothetical protein
MKPFTFVNGNQPQIFSKMEDDIYFCKRKTTSYSNLMKTNIKL